MFGLSRKERIASLQRQLTKVKNDARHFYNVKGEVAERAFYALAELARDRDISAREAAKTKDGLIILSEIVLNRQWAFYLNEQAIQIQAQINALTDSKHNKDIGGKAAWFDKVVTPAGLDIVMDQIQPMCGELISEVDEYLTV
ncbi:hypothetical protein BFG07_08815 [Kosakonia cowanii]|uniref:hypothetical protein n=1 Tax=Kosakonia cowanii TaxID=208223 RepID=UPI000B965F68|nr:hypothetical protein [Kosakonia cowanii]AST68779.1 hypothetical protein BFG07_08815 [Kosakonia cowanii]